MVFKKDLIKLKKKYKIHTIRKDIKNLKYVKTIKMYKILTEIHLNYKFKKITFKKIQKDGITDCLAKGVKILDGMKLPIQQVSLSKNFPKEYSFLLFSKAFIALYVFVYSVVSIFSMVSLKTLALLSWSEHNIDPIGRAPLILNLGWRKPKEAADWI